jgi:hypothetical protein
VADHADTDRDQHELQAAQRPVSYWLRQANMREEIGEVALDACDVVILVSSDASLDLITGRGRQSKSGGYI